MISKLWVIFETVLLVFLLNSLLYAQSNYQLIKDIEGGNFQGVKYAIESGISANSMGGQYKESLLNLAAQNGHTEIAKYLIEKGAKINKVTGVFGGMTPLIRASQSCYLDIVKILIDKGANPNLTNEGTYYTNPLYSSATRGCLDVAKLLLLHNADINFVSGTGHTVLTGAIVSSPESDIAIMLVEAGANVNQPAYGKHPIHYAIEEFPIISNYDPNIHNKWADGFVKLIKLLLDKDVRTGTKTKNGETLIELVQKKFDRVYEPLSIEIDLKKQDEYHLVGELKSGKPKAKKTQMELFYQQKAQEILNLIDEFRNK